MRNEREFNLYHDTVKPCVHITKKSAKPSGNIVVFAIILGAFLWALHATAPLLQALFSLI